MAEITKPTEKPRWATGNTALIQTPTEGKKDSGWSTSDGTATGTPEKPPLQYFNWLAKWTSQWVDYTEGKLDLTLGNRAPQALTIASDSVTPTLPSLVLDTEAAAASDNLATIIGTAFDEGRLILLSAANGARTIVLKHANGGAGQMFLSTAADTPLNSTSRRVLLEKRGSDWYEVSRNFISLVTDTEPTLGGALIPNNFDIGFTTARVPTVFANKINKTNYVSTNPEVGGSSPFQMIFTDNTTSVLNPAADITVRLPSTSVIANTSYTLKNRSNFKVTVQSSAGNTIYVLSQGVIELSPTQSVPTANTHWVVEDVRQSGIYTPTISNTTLISGLTHRQSNYLQVGNTVLITSFFEYSDISPGTTQGFDMSLPIATGNFVNAYPVTGVANLRDALGTSATGAGTITAVTGSMLAGVRILPSASGAGPGEITLSFSYRIQ